MARTKAWREIVRKALRGGPWTNAEVYKRAAHEIGAKTLTTNQKAKVRQQMQLVGEHPTGVKKGAYKLQVKLPSKKAIEKAIDDTSHASNLGFLGEVDFGEREKDEHFHKNSRLFVYEFEVTDDIEFKALQPFAKELERLYGKVDCAIHLLYEILDVNTNEKLGEQWATLTYGGSPMIAVQQAPAAIEKLETKSEGIYHLHNVIKLSFLLFVPT